MDTPPTSSASNHGPRHFRFHFPHRHLSPVFGNDWFALKAEAFARFFGTPFFLVGQTLVVGIWIFLNAVGITHFDLYPFILLNLAFSTQAAYAAPLILLAQTRQAERDKVLAEADAQHREELAKAGMDRQAIAEHQNEQIQKLLEQNTELTQQTMALAKRIDSLTGELHKQICKS